MDEGKRRWAPLPRARVPAQPRAPLVPELGRKDAMARRDEIAEFLFQNPVDSASKAAG